MEGGQDLVDEIDSDVSNLVPLNDQLKLCSDVLAESDDFDTKSETTESDKDNVAPNTRVVPSCSADNFHVSKESIPCVPKAEQEKELLDLGVSVYDQTQFETEVMDQVDKALKVQEEKKRIDDASKELRAVEEDIRFVRQRLIHIEKAMSMAPKDPNLMTSAAKRELSAIKNDQLNKLKHLKKLEAKRKALQVCISGSADEVSTSLQGNFEAGEEDMDEETLYHLQQVFTAKETEEERLIRTGEMTPFGTMNSNNRPKPRTITIPENQLTDFDKFLLTEAENHITKKTWKTPKPSTPINRQHSKPSTSKLASKDIIEPIESSDFVTFTDLKAVSVKSKTLPKVKLGSKHAKGYSKKENLSRGLVKNYRSDSDISDIEMDDEGIKDDVNDYSDDDVYIPDGDYSGDEDYDDEKKAKGTKKKKNSTPHKKPADASNDAFSESESKHNKPVKSQIKKVVDDGNQSAFIKRIKAFEKSELIQKHQKIMESEDGVVDSDEEDVTEFEEEYKIPNSVWNKLYKYQQTAVRWLWELHQQNCGGIVGDEMGLGKTIQIIAFFVGLKYSKLLTICDSFRGLGPVILVCPATVMHQWVKEFHTWWPPFRVAVLHSQSGSFVGKKGTLIQNINKSHGVLITSYAGVVQHQESLLKHEWHYVVLDEGHKIRNPDAQATLAVKQFRTSHRIILSGSPVQNNLKELWSLFDFIFPGKLGTLPVFMQQFSVPIVLGGYSNASQVQVQTAYKCATVLRDAIKPYLLRRMKSDVKMNINLPNKSEQVLFCQLTEEQANLYKGYIDSKEVSSILNAKLQVFVGLINLRKICNHPDIFDGGPKIMKDTDVSLLSDEERYGFYKRSGKMIVVEALLRLWHTQGHRVLLFTQSRQMMDILELFVKKRSYTYMKMDGTTSISSRQPAIAKFNSDPSIFVFLLTTRVGGLGVNLTGANRVILYDPDWNPSTDAQARERAWRIGQMKQVTIYRLLTAGTIEEKIYHRQIFKQFVTNRVLKDPRQRRFFKSNDLLELFTYKEVGSQGTETSAIFAGTGSEIKPKKRPQKKHSPRDLAVIPVKNGELPVSFSDEKREQMKLLAKKLSLELAKKSPDTKTDISKSGELKAMVEKNSSVIECKSDLEKEKCKLEMPRAVSKEKTPRKSQKRRAAKIEGEKIDFLVKKSVYKPPQDEEEKNLKQDDYVLSRLFRKSGVHTALKHDSIVEATAPDHLIVEGEASRVAKEAIKALKKSRRLCARAQDGVPTWTGQHGGIKPRFGPKKRLVPSSTITSKSDESSKSSPSKLFTKKVTLSDEALSSNDLLSVIKKRKVVFGTDEKSDDSDGESTPGLTTNTVIGTEHDELLVEIRNYIAFRAGVDGQATTKELIDAFRDKLPINQTAIFKAMLSKICDFSRSSSGEGIWYLKGDFR